jgi:hypothetical protein
MQTGIVCFAFRSKIVGAVSTTRCITSRVAGTAAPGEFFDLRSALLIAFFVADAK